MKNRKKSKRVSFGEARKITFSMILNIILPLVADALISTADIYKYNKFDGYLFSRMIIALTFLEMELTPNFLSLKPAALALSIYKKRRSV